MCVHLMEGGRGRGRVGDRADPAKPRKKGQLKQSGNFISQK